MLVTQLMKLIGRQIRIIDQRTGQLYLPEIVDVKEVWGKIRIQVKTDGPWFEPTTAELASVGL